MFSMAQMSESGALQSAGSEQSSGTRDAGTFNAEEFGRLRVALKSSAFLLGGR
jgi:hypothetical protein